MIMHSALSAMSSMVTLMGIAIGLMLVAIVIAVLRVRHNRLTGSSARHGGPEDADDLLRQRYARGGISRVDYLQGREDLRR